VHPAASGDAPASRFSNSPARADSVALCAKLGNHHHQITTRVTEAHHYYQLGLRLVFGVSRAEESPALKQGARP